MSDDFDIVYDYVPLDGEGNAALKRIEARLREAEKDVDALTSDLEDAEARFREAEEAGMRQLRAEAEAHRQTNNKRLALEADLAEVRQSGKALEARLREAEDKWAGYWQRAHEAEELGYKAHWALGEAEARVEELEQERDAATGMWGNVALADAADKLYRAEQENERLREARDFWVKERQSYARTANQLSEENERLRNEIFEYAGRERLDRAEIERLQAQVESSRYSDADAALERAEDAEEKYEGAKAQYNDVLKPENEKLRARITELEQENERLSARLRRNQ